MTKFKKKGFTIVELVIVIAVIAILAAVLIPTFSNIIKKANLSADKQAVREMNSALAEWEALHGYSSKPADVESAMNILEEAGFNAENWVCLTADYQVWWSKTKNRCVLYNSRTAEVEYPEEYKTVDLLNAANGWYIYNANHITAQQFQLSLGSAEGATSQTSFSNAVSKNNPTDTVSSTEVQTQINDKMNTLITSNTSDVKRSILGSNDTSGSVHVFATKEKVSSVSGTTDNGAYASLNVASVSATTEAITLKDSVSGEDKLAENFYFLTIVKTGEPTATDLAKASQAAGQMLYNIFDQVTTKKIPDEITIVLDTTDAPITIDVSACEWAPCKTFCGYFGASNPENPIIIDGARLTSATGFAQTVQLNGSNSKYFLTGFFGTVYGNTTIENVIFKNLTINSPATDYELLYGSNAAVKDKTGGNTNSRNTVGIIGGITDGADEVNNAKEANVVLKNISVEKSCNIIGAACVGGLVGYIGSTNLATNLSGIRHLTGTILIEGCKIAASVASLDQDGESYNSAGYGACGGIVGFSCRCKNTNITIKNCEFTGTINGYKHCSAIIDKIDAGNVFLEGKIKVDGNYDTEYHLGQITYNNNYQTGKGYLYVTSITSSDMTSSNMTAYNIDTTGVTEYDIPSSIPAFAKGGLAATPLVLTYYNYDGTTWTPVN